MSENSSETSGVSGVSADNIFGNIFAACDPNCTGVVQTSKIVEYIKPFLKEKISKLWELKNALDPKDEDEEVDVSKFYSVMSEWTSKFCVEGEHLSDDSFRTDVSDVDNMLPFKQSTPRQSLGNRLRMGYAETELISSSPGINNSDYLDKSAFEDQIKELNHQNKKYFDEISILKVQLASFEENNELLQKELEKTKCRLQLEHEACDGYKRQLQQGEHVREDLAVAEEEILQLKKKLSVTERDKNVLKQKFDVLEHEKLQLQENLNRKQKKLSELNLKINILKEGLECKTKEIISLEDTNNKLEVNLQERDTVIEQYIEHIENLTKEKDQCKKYLAQQSEENSARHFQALSKYKSFSKSTKDALDESYRKLTLSSTKTHAETTTRHNTNTSPTTTLVTTSPKTTMQNYTNQIVTPTKTLSPKPFTSPIQTKRFTFYDEDSPIARSSNSEPKSKKALFSTNEIDSFTPNVLKGDDSISETKTTSYQNPSNDSFDVHSLKTPNNLQIEMAQADGKFQHNCDSTTVFTNNSNSSLEIVDPKLLDELKDVKQKLLNSNTACDKLLSENFELKESLLQKSELDMQIEEMKKENEVIRMKLLDLYFKDHHYSDSICNIFEAGMEDREEIKNEWKELRNKGAEAEKITKEVSEIKDKLQQRLLENSMKSKEVVKNLEKQQEIKNQRIDDLEREKEDNLILIDKLSTENCKLINDIETMEALMKKQVEDLNNQYVDLSADHNKFLELKSELDNVKIQYTEKIESLKQTIHNLQKDKIHLENQSHDLLSGLCADTSKRFTELENKLDQSHKSIINLTKTAKSQETEIIRLEQGISVNDDLQIAIKNMEIEKAEIDKTVKSLKLEKVQLHQEVLNLNQEKQALLESLRIAKADNITLINNNEGEISKITKEKHELSEKFESLRVEHEALIENAQKCEETLISNLNSSKIEHQKIISIKKDEIFALNNKNHELLEELNELQFKNNMLLQQLNNDEEIVKTVKDKNNELLRKLNALEVKNEVIYVKQRASISTQTEDKVSSLTPKFNRLKVQLEKTENRCEYLETQLEAERLNKVRTHEKLQDLLRAYEEEKAKNLNDIDRQNQAAVEKLYNLQQQLRSSLKCCYKSKQIQLENFPSCICDEIKENLSNIGFDFNKSLLDLKNEVDLCCLFLKELEGVNESFDTENNQPRSLKKFSLKPPTLLYRPVSPDSPNLECLVENFKSDLEDNCLQADSAGAGDNNYDSGSEDLNLSDFKDQDSNQSIYEDALNVSFSLENLSHFYEELVKEGSEQKNLEENFTTLVLEYTLDKSTIKSRIKIKAAELDLLLRQALTIITKLKGTNLGQKDTHKKLVALSTVIHQFTRFAKQLGALEQEEKYLNSSNVIINYAADLRKRLDLTAPTLQKSTSTTEVAPTSYMNRYGPRILKMLTMMFVAVLFGSAWYLLVSNSAGSCNILSSGRGRGHFDDYAWENVLTPFLRVEYRNPPPT